MIFTNVVIWFLLDSLLYNYSVTLEEVWWTTKEVKIIIIVELHFFNDITVKIFYNL